MKDAKFEILHEDGDIAVVSKEAGLLTIPDRYDPGLPCLKALLQERFGGIFVVHRLDRETSGLLVFARNEEAHRALCLQFERREAKKLYHAVVAGSPEQDILEANIPLGTRNEKVVPDPRGKESVTIFRVLRRFRNAALLECELLTGRTHQIRAHCAALGHPLLVDRIYGSADAFYLSSIKKNYRRKGSEESPVISRSTLHARSLAFLHPRSGERMEFQAPYPADFERLCRTLDKYGR